MVAVANIYKDRSIWACLSIVLGQEEGDPLTSSNIYNAVVQVTILFGLETWVVTPRLWSNLGGFHHRVARHIAVIQPKQYMVGRW